MRPNKHMKKVAKFKHDRHCKAALPAQTSQSSNQQATGVFRQKQSGGIPLFNRLGMGNCAGYVTTGDSQLSEPFAFTQMCRLALQKSNQSDFLF